MAYRFNPFTNQLDFYQEDTQFVSSGAIANLTSGQQDAIREGSIVTTTDGRRWAYSGTGSKTAESSYVELADITPEWSVIASKPSTFPPSAHASSHFTSGADAISPADIGAAPASHTHASSEITMALANRILARVTAGSGPAEEIAASTARTLLELGTAATEAATAFAAASHSHAAADITSGTFGISLIPTGTTSTTVALGDHTHTQLHDRSHAITSTSDHTAGNHKVFYSDGSGNIQELALGSSGQVLTSNGTSSAPSFATASGGITAIGTSAADALSISGSDLVADDPGADRILFWDDSADKLTHLEVGTGLSISGTTLSVTGGVTTGSTDNAILRADGTGGATLQNSAIVIDDATTSTQANVAIVNAHSETNSALVLTPKGTGAFILGPKPDGTATGGNARGANAVDLQTNRGAATQVASGQYAFIGGGSGNTASGIAATCIGETNIASGQRAIAAGNNSTASGISSIAYGGSVANTTFAFAIGWAVQSTALGGLALGRDSRADRTMMQAHAGGQFAANGDAQRARFVLRNKTTNATATELFLDGSSTRLTIPSGKTIGGTIQIAGASSGGEEAVHYIRQFLIRNRGGTTGLIGSIQTVGTDIESTGLSACSVTLTADDTNDSLKVEVEGPAALTGCTIEADDDIITKTAHGLTADTDIVFTSLTGGAGLTANTVTYWVRDVTTDSFKVSATRGGAAVNITTDYTDATVARVIRWVANVDATEIGFGT